MTDQPRADAMLCGIHAEYNPTCHMCTADQPRADPIAALRALRAWSGPSIPTDLAVLIIAAERACLAALAPADPTPCRHDAKWIEEYTDWAIRAYKQQHPAPADPTADLRAALQKALDAMAYYLWDEDDSGDENMLVDAHDALRDALDAVK